MNSDQGYRVLVPLDGSPLAEYALMFLPALSHLANLNIRLVTVIDASQDLALHLTEEDHEHEASLIDTYLREVQTDIGRHLNAPVESKVSAGDASQEILDEAAQWQPDLLVIATHGRSGLSRWHRGSVADKVIRGAECAVLAIGPKALETGRWHEAEMVAPFKRILVPLDGSSSSEQALPLASRFARSFKAEVHLLRVMPFVPFFQSTTFADEPSQRILDIEAEGSEYLAGIADSLAGLQPVAHSIVGEPASAIYDYIREHDIDLVAMASHGRGGFSRAVLGSVTDKLIGSGPPVLIVRTTDEDSQANLTTPVGNE